ncbi:MAG: hypothetical protein HYS81_02025 [Candidatus Aenigmatarchaeota archaeon]|nr:MAG: hypothetical protein HYS81_02025 [Candidatus Aenigmarchaeota archaeon]
MRQSGENSPVKQLYSAVSNNYKKLRSFAYVAASKKRCKNGEKSEKIEEEGSEKGRQAQGVSRTQALTAEETNLLPLFSF